LFKKILVVLDGSALASKHVVEHCKQPILIVNENKTMNKEIGTDWKYPSDVGNSMSAHDVDDARASESVRCL
jgi:hypothetical protein